MRAYMLNGNNDRIQYAAGVLGVVLVDSSTVKDSAVVLVQPYLGVEVSGQIHLADFKHPDDCVYVFGPDHGRMTLDYVVGLRIVDTVYIPAVEGWEFYCDQAMAVVAWDRYVKVRANG